VSYEPKTRAGKAIALLLPIVKRHNIKHPAIRAMLMQVDLIVQYADENKEINNGLEEWFNKVIQLCSN
jgi:hypothetical protein